MQNKSLRRLLSGILAAAVAVNGLIVATPADNADDGSLSLKKVSNSSVSATLPDREVFEETKEASIYADTDVVRVSIVLKDKSTIEAGYEVKDIANNQAAMDYRAGLQRKQEDVVAQIEKVIEEQLDVVWNLTLAANLISANVEYGQIETIEKLSDVKEVVIENQYQPDVLNQPIATDPNMATSSEQIGSKDAWAAGYTGAGSRVAIIDTGADYEHQSLDSDAFMHSLEQLAEAANKTVDEYVAGLKLMTAAEIDGVKDKLNIGKRGGEALIDSTRAYLNAKIPFAYNYVDKNYTTNHASDTQGNHGSHVAGIATANKYIPNGDGTFTEALKSEAHVQGVAPDAQLLVMKVFGKGGGAFDADYMAAIEDAIVLNADSVNLSLGSGNPGMSTNKTYQNILNKIAESGVVVAMSAGNSGMWAENSNNLTGYLYADDVSMQTDGSPGSYTNSLAVASVDNAGSVNNYFTVGDVSIPYTETGYKNKPFTTLAGEELEYVFLDGDGVNKGFGTEADWAAIGDDLAGKVAVCWRGGGVNFSVKGNNAVKAGAIAVILCNNADGIINMDLSDYTGTAPFVSITKADGLIMKQLATLTEPAAANAEEEEVLPEGENTPAQADEETAPEADEEIAPEADEDVSEADEDVSEAEENEEAAEDETAPEEAEDTEAAEKNAEDVQAAATAAYYLGTMTVAENTGIFEDDSQYYTMSDFSSWGVPGSLQLKPEITAPGGNIYSISGYNTEDGKTFNGGPDKYENMSGTSMASPQVAGMAAVAAQYVRDKKLVEKTGKSARVLIQSLLMSTAEPVIEDLGEDGASYYSILKQGAGLANINNVVTADSYILMKEDATVSYKDGKVKAELGDDPDRTGKYSFSFSINNLTDTAKTYDLDSVFFIQYPFQYYANQAGKLGLYMDTSTAIIDTEATFSTGNSVTVAAGGSADVTVTIQLTDSDKDIIDLYYENGAYIEGFVYAESAGDAEGNEGTSHSIPVLGFYGSWTEASMFDVGSHIEKIAGEEDRIPYVAKNLDSNAIGVTYAGDSQQYYFGGNPLIPDETYMPERNAIGANGTISAITFVAIRNAADSRFTVYNETKDTLIKETNPGAVSSAYYYTNGGTWQNTGYTLRPMYTPTGVADGDKINIALTLAPEYYVGADGKTAWDKLGEGASLAVSATVDNIEPVIKKVDLDEENNVLRVVASDNNYISGVVLYNNAGTIALSFEGAKQVIDAGEEAVYELSVEGVNGRKFLLQAYDYAMNTATYEITQKLGGDVPLPERIAFNLDDNYWVGFDKTSDHNAMDVVYTPADKTFTAATIVDHIVFAATDGGELFVMPEDDLTDLTKVCDLGVVLTDMAYNSADGNIYAACNGYLITVDKLTGELAIVDEFPVLSNTLACDAEGTFYCNEYGTPDVYSFTVEDGTISEPELLCSADIPRTQYIQSMEINPNDGMLCWTSYYAMSIMGFVIGDSYYYEIDPSTGECVEYEDLRVELAALIIPDKSELLYDFNGDGIVDYLDGQALLDYRTGVIDSIHNEEYADINNDDIIDTYDAYLFFQMNWATPTSKVTDIQISDEKISILRGGEYQLSAYVLPWTASNRDVAWSTSDASIATVDANGNVTAVEKGKCVITATSKANENVKAECAVTVDVVDVTLNGVLQDADGNPLFFEWNMAEDSTWTKVHELGTSLTSATQVDGNTVFVMDGIADTWAMHKVDAATGDVLETAANPLGLPLWDMQYSEVFSATSYPMVSGVYGYYLLPVKDPMNLDGSAFKLDSRLSQYGANYFVALTSMGAETIYDEEDDEIYVTERLIALDNAGNFWIFNILPTPEGYSTHILTYRSDLEISFPGHEDDMYCSMVYGGDGRLYLSAFDGDTNNFYRITMNDATKSCTAEYIGNVGDTVWPAALLSADSNSPAPASVSTSFFSANGLDSVKPQNQVKVDSITVTDRDKITLNAESAEDAVTEEVVLASVKSKYGASESEDSTEENVDVKTIDKNTETFTIQLGATNSDNEPVDSTNGLAIVTYDPEVLELVSVDIGADYTSVKIDEEIGFAILGYVSPDEAIPAGTLFETLTFKVKDIEKADGTLIGVGVAELGNGGTAEEPNHSNLLIEYSTPLYENIDDAETIAEIMEDILPSTNVRVEVSEEPVPDDPDVPVVTIPSNGNFIDPYAPGGAMAPETTEPGNTTAPAESNDPAGNDPASTTADNSSDPASSDPAGNDPSGNEVSTGTDAPNSGDGNGNAGNAGDVNAPNDEDKNQYTGVGLFIAPAAISALAVLVTKKHRN